MKKIPIWKNVVLIISVLVFIIIATFAWLSKRNYGYVNDLAIGVSNASYVLVSDDDGESWSEELDVKIVHDNFKEISGDGFNFFAPVYDTVKKIDGTFGNEIIGYNEADKSLYFEQSFLFQTDATNDIYLSPKSYVGPVKGKSSDFIEGAVRVAFFEIDEDNNEILRLIWAPNSKIEFYQGSQSFTDKGSVERNYYYQKTKTPVDISTLTEGEENPDVGVISTADSDNPSVNLDCGYNAEHKFMWSNGEDLPENAPPILSVKVDEDDDVEYRKMKIKVWLEGYDRECVSQLSGKKFSMNFHFDKKQGE